MFFPRGVYDLSEALDAKSGLTLYGDGAGSILKAGTAGENIIDVVGVSSVDRISDITIRDLGFDGAELSNTHGIYAKFTDRVLVSSCHCEDFGNASDTIASAIYFDNENYDTTIKGNYITGGVGETNGADIIAYANGGDLIITGNRTYSANSHGIGAGHGNKTKRVIISDNISKNHTRHGILAEYAGGDYTDAINHNCF